MTYNDMLAVVQQGQTPKFFQVSKTFMMGMSDDALVTLSVLGSTSKEGFTIWSVRDKLYKLGEWSANFYFPVDAGCWVSLSPDGSLFLFSTGSGQNGIGFISLKSDPAQAYIMQGMGVVKNTTFSPDGRLLATHGADGFIRVWGVPKAP